MPRPPSRKLADRKARVGRILAILKKTYPDAKCRLDHHSPLELLVATILSAQSTDDRVNIVTRSLFRKYPDAAAYARVSQEELEKDIHSTGFYRNKARSIRAMAQALIDQHAGEVPRTMEALFALPGVGRKTANVVLGNAFHINVGITVDTHVTRVSNRLGLTDHKTDAVKIERDLMQLTPREDWALWSHLLIFHGRAICTARNPKCATCPILADCPTGKALVEEAAKKESAGPTRRGKGRSKEKVDRA